MTSPHAGSSSFSAVVANGLAQTYSNAYIGSQTIPVPPSRPIVGRIPTQTGVAQYGLDRNVVRVATQSENTSNLNVEDELGMNSSVGRGNSIQTRELQTSRLGAMNAAFALRRASIGPTHISTTTASGSESRRILGNGNTSRTLLSQTQTTPVVQNQTSSLAIPRYAAPTQASSHREQRAQNLYAATVQTTITPVQSLLTAGPAPSTASRRASLSATLPPSQPALFQQQQSSNMSGFNSRISTVRRESLAGLPLSSTFGPSQMAGMHIRPGTAAVTIGIPQPVRSISSNAPNSRFSRTVHEDGKGELSIDVRPSNTQSARDAAHAAALSMRPGTAPVPFAVGSQGLTLPRTTPRGTIFNNTMSAKQPQAVSPSNLDEVSNEELDATKAQASKLPLLPIQGGGAFRSSIVKQTGPHPRPTAASLALAARFSHNRPSTTQLTHESTSPLALNTYTGQHQYKAPVRRTSNPQKNNEEGSETELNLDSSEVVNVVPVDHGFGPKKCIEEETDHDDSDECDGIETQNTAIPEKVRSTFGEISAESSTKEKTNSSNIVSRVNALGDTNISAHTSNVSALSVSLQSQLAFTPRERPSNSSIVRPSTTAISTRSGTSASSGLNEKNDIITLASSSIKRKDATSSVQHDGKPSQSSQGTRRASVAPVPLGVTSDASRPQTSHGASNTGGSRFAVERNSSKRSSSKTTSQNSKSSTTGQNIEPLDLKKLSGINAYVLGEPLGEGTFGKVRKGKHVITGMPVAIKVLEKQRMRSREDLERVEREIDLLQRVDHPDVIRLYEVIRANNVIYLVMEYCSSGSLFDHIVKRGRLTERESCRVFHHVLNGVAHCHSVSVCHRDLKPENLLLTDEGRSIKLVDFGLGNVAGPSELLSTACGSPCYAAPEMLAGRSYKGTISDMWSLGVVLFALVCGYLPFDDPNTARLYDKIRAGSYTLPSHLSRGAADLIRSLLVTDPNRRFTPAHVRKHPWYCGLTVSTDPFFSNSSASAAQSTSSNGKSIPVIDTPLVKTSDLDLKILNYMHHLGLDADQTLKSIWARKRNLLTTTYLLFSEKNRLGKLEMPDLPESLSHLPASLVSLKLGLPAPAAFKDGVSGIESPTRQEEKHYHISMETIIPSSNTGDLDTTSSSSNSPGMLAEAVRRLPSGTGHIPRTGSAAIANYVRRGSDPGAYSMRHGDNTVAPNSLQADHHRQVTSRRGGGGLSDIKDNDNDGSHEDSDVSLVLSEDDNMDHDGDGGGGGNGGESDSDHDTREVGPTRTMRTPSGISASEDRSSFRTIPIRYG